MTKETPTVRLRMIIALLVPASFALVSCNHPWYLVESKFQGITTGESPPEITRTNRYDETVRPRIKVGVTAPDRCANRTAAEATGKAVPAGEWLSTDCGVEMAELERALAAAGYEVVSWSAIQQRVVREEGVTPLAAAKGLGAKVLFQVNSLERSRATPDQELDWTRGVYESDSKGIKGADVTSLIPPERTRALEEGVAVAESYAIPPNQPVSVTASVTAILVETGESIWFYSWTHSRGFRGTASTMRLFKCNRKILSRCLPRQLPQATSTGVAAAPPLAGSTGSVSVPEQSANSKDAAYYLGVREVVADLVERFGR